MLVSAADIIAAVNLYVASLTSFGILLVSRLSLNLFQSPLLIIHFGFPLRGWFEFVKDTAIGAWSLPCRSGRTSQSKLGAKTGLHIERSIADQLFVLGHK